MIPKECRRLAEVDFPIARVSSSSLRENAQRGSHPKGLHLWWARRPLAACRSVLLALLLPDPTDPHCPGYLADRMRETLLGAPGRPARWESDSRTPEGLRRIALDFIAQFSCPENARSTKHVRCAQDLVKDVGYAGQPLVYDPFAGGGSIPLEALRLGCDAIGSDLNPLACLVLRSELELLPRCAENILDDLQEAGAIIETRLRSRLQDFFAKENDNSIPIAYFWARQAACESPNCGVTFPLATSFWLCKRADHETGLRFSPAADNRSLHCEVFHPSSSSEVPRGTVAKGRGRCPACGATLTNARLRAQLARHHGGIEEAKLLAVATQDPSTGRKVYRAATPADIEAGANAKVTLARILDHADGVALFPIPNEDIPRSELRRVSAPLYGCSRWQDLFVPRQLLSLCLLVEEINRYTAERGRNSLLPLLTLAFGKVVRHWNSGARWHTKGENVAGAFGRQAIPMAYFFPEQSPLFSNCAGSWPDAVKSVASAARAIVNLGNAGHSLRADACDVPLPSESVAVWFTDPPYYDAVAYAHLADFFYVWLRRLMLGDPLFTTALIDKTQECVVDRPHSQSPSQKRADWFEKKIGEAMVEGRRVLTEDGIACVVFAHKSTEGWEAIISAMLKAGWVITASWPIATEREARLNARENASLATSVHLICRPRTEERVGDWSDVLRELPKRVADWMERLQAEGVRGADLVFACIGPALEIYSRYSKVVDAEEREIPLGGDPEAKEPHKRGYLAYVWEVVGRTALEQVLGTAEAKARNSAAGALEEDARLPALFLWTLQSTEGIGSNGQRPESENDEPDEDEDKEQQPKRRKPKGMSLIYDVVRRFAQPLGIHLDEWEDRIIETDKGVVRLLPVKGRAGELFGEAGASAAADRLESEPAGPVQLSMFPEDGTVPQIKGRRGGRGRGQEVTGEDVRTRRGATTLDRVHAAMLLQASGRSNALRALAKAEQERGPDFLRLANALSALYPKGSEEKRLLDAMLLAVPR